MRAQVIPNKNADFQKFEVLLTNRVKRRRYGEFLVEGVRNINEAVRNNWRIASFLFPREKKLSGWAEQTLSQVDTEMNYALADGLLAELSGKDEPSELMAIVKMRGEDEFPKITSSNPMMVLFDRPSNKGNLGTMFRSCDGFGADCLFVCGHGVDVYEPEVVGSSMGSFFSVPFYKLDGNAQIEKVLADLRARFPGMIVAGTTAHGGRTAFTDGKAVFNVGEPVVFRNDCEKPPEEARLTDIPRTVPVWEVDLTSPVLFLIGNETDGLNHFLTGLCDVPVTVPMSENSAASSLNVSCAGTVLMYEARRQRESLCRR